MRAAAELSFPRTRLLKRLTGKGGRQRRLMEPAGSLDKWEKEQDYRGAPFPVSGIAGCNFLHHEY
jgi:hypothetical protein